MDLRNHNDMRTCEKPLKRKYANPECNRDRFAYGMSVIFNNYSSSPNEL